MKKTRNTFASTDNLKSNPNDADQAETLRFTLEIIKLITPAKTLMTPDVRDLNDVPLKFARQISSK